MTEETDATVDGGSEAEAIAEVSTEVESNSEATAEQDTGTEQTGQADDTGEEQPKRVPWFQKRIDEVTAKKYEAEREAAYWRGIAEGRIPQEQPRQEATQPPDRWEDPEGYDQWLVDQATQRAIQQFEQKTQHQTTLRSYEERAAKVRESKPDYDSVVNNPNLRITPLMANVIRTREAGAEVAYHLGKNPQEADRISRLPDELQAAELGVLEARLTAAPAPQQRRDAPPPPPKTVGGLSAGINKDPADMSMAEYARWMETRDKN